MSGHYSVQEILVGALVLLNLSGNVLPGGSYNQRKTIVDSWNWIIERFADVFDEFIVEREKGLSIDQGQRDANMGKDLTRYVTSGELQGFCVDFLKIPDEGLPSDPDAKRKNVEKFWRDLTKRNGDLFKDFHIRKGRGQGKGVETYYPEKFLPIILGAMRRKIKKEKPLEIDKWLIPELIHAGLIKHRYRFLFELIYDRALTDVFNLSEKDPAAFKKKLNKILLSRGKQVEFEWRTKVIRKRVSTDPSSDSNPTKADVNLLSMGLDVILQDGEPKQGMRWNMDVAEIEDILDDFHNRRLHVLDLFRQTLSGDAQSAKTLERMGAEVIDSMPSGWLVDTPEDSETDRTLRRRPENLVEYVLLRLTWMWREEQESLKGAEGSFMELLQSRFLSCPECGRIEMRFRKGDKHQCRVCRGMDGEVRLRRPKR